MKSGGTGFQPMKEFRIYRRNLPHWEWPQSVYFLAQHSRNQNNPSLSPLRKGGHRGGVKKLAKKGSFYTVIL